MNRDDREPTPTIVGGQPVGKQDGEPQPRGDQPCEPRRPPDGEHGGDDRSDVNHEHHRIARLVTRIEFPHCLRDRGEELARIERST